MKIYLAGKMDAEHGAWRDHLLTSSDDLFDRLDGPHWEQAVTISDEDGWYPLEDIIMKHWPLQANSLVLGKHDYVGPYRTTFKLKSGADIDSKNHGGYFHGSLLAGQHGSPDWGNDYEGRIVRECESAIRRADLCFAYINTFDCYGTMTEIGYAKAAGVFTVVALDGEAISSELQADEYFTQTEYWFSAQLADAHVDVPWRKGLKAAHPQWSDVVIEGCVVNGAFKNALVEWVGRSDRSLEKRNVTEAELHRTVSEVERKYSTVLRRYSDSFSQIAQWTSDPRVRGEAQRMLRLLAG